MRRGLIGLLLSLALLCGCGGGAAAPAGDAQAEKSAETMPLQYARQFSVEYDGSGGALITVGGTDRFYLPAENESAAAPEGAVRLSRPAEKVYLAASSAMDLFLQLDALGAVGFTSTTAGNWALPEVRAAMEAGEMAYAGKYSAPDFELLLSSGCNLAVESTMIYHSPEVKEQLEALGIPVLVERSSYEPHPLGRVEWIKLYGLLLGKAAEAEAFFDAQVRLLSALENRSAEKPRAAFFHLSTAGAAVVRKPGDFVSRMIELAGGEFVFSELPGSDDNALSTMNMQLEAFYAGAKDADVLIYNSAIAGELETLDQLLAKSELFSDFKAVREGNVWCAEQSLFQKSSAAAGMIRDFHAVFTGTAEDDLTFLHRLK